MEKYEVVARLLLAIAAGGLIGYERSFKNRPAGFRTHILVCVGAAVISMIQIEIVEQTKAMLLEYPVYEQALKVDMGRMGAQVITGVGFLGAGTIIREKGLVKGLTTAASVWVVACIGLAVGLGMYFISIISTIGVFIALFILKKVEKKFIDQSHIIELEIEYKEDKEFIKKVQKYFRVKNIRVNNMRFYDSDLNEEADENKRIVYTLAAPRYIKKTRIIQDLSDNKGIINLKVL